jgi:hypothetical protein
MEADMAEYDAPAITELGSVSDFTRGSGWGLKWDGWRMVEVRGHEIPVPDFFAS